ncbi:MAG: transcription-repair coupling factor [Dehalococcoidia bacterium]|nr:transcription-repair coupling factor [Dehalococcoidia bacterium]
MLAFKGLEMGLQGVLSLIGAVPAYRAVVDGLNGTGQRRCSVPEFGRAYVLAALANEVRRPMVVLTAKPEAARQLAEDISAFLGDESGVRVLHCSEHDALPYERLAVDEGVTHARLQAMGALVGGTTTPPRPALPNPSNSSFDFAQDLRPSLKGRGESRSGQAEGASVHGSSVSPRTGIRTVAGGKGRGTAPSLVPHLALNPSPKEGGTSPVATALQVTVVVASLSAAAQRTVAPGAFVGARETIRVGEDVETGALLGRLGAMGYRVERAVEVPGTASLRGGILDIFSPDSPLPARIELFGNTVESIRLFDPATQRSVEERQSYEVMPAQEVLPALADLDKAREALGRLKPEGVKEDEWERIRSEMGTLLEHGQLEEAFVYSGFLCQGSLLDYLPKDGLLILDEPLLLEQTGADLQKQSDELYATKRQRGDIPENFLSHSWDWATMQRRLGSARLVLEWLNAAPTERRAEFGFDPAPNFWGRLETFAKSIREMAGAGKRLVVVSQHARRLHEVLGERAVGASLVDDLKEEPAPGSVTVVHHGSLLQGFTLPLPAHLPLNPLRPGSESATSPKREGLEQGLEPPARNEALQDALVVVTDAEVFGQVKRQRPIRRHVIRREAFLSELTPGMYLVHVDHGIGRFTGTNRVQTEQGEREYLILEFAENDKLFVPTESLDRLSPYVAPGDQSPTLTRLGTQEWARATERAKKTAHAMAQELLDLYAARQVVQREPYPPDSPWQREMEDSFPYIETPDQATAIADVKADMEKTTPMDRLVCGDVGYGKTEVALRAAFKAAQDGKQVAVLCPTTILAQQHYATFSERLAPYPVKVDVLHRYRTKEEAADLNKRIKEGGVDIVIGTHRLLQKDVSFKHLGLAVVDDEQRFGVAHKERLKQMRKEVDVLTLSATPIPRTLYMALAGVRDMSTVQTPPESRVPVRTFVSEYSDDLVRTAVLREIDRGGQVFFVHNRVKDIYEWAQKIQALVPGARVLVGHGQMAEGELSDVMEQFVQGKADVLVCTTIIEAGLDIPNANTMLVHRPDLLGLAQMYQLRGRVGRGAHQAYAYFLLTPSKILTEMAEKRLKAILAHQELGAGFRIAMRDLELRGAGNILGMEQSGQIQAVGFDLYVLMLEQAVKELKDSQAAVQSGTVTVAGTPMVVPSDVKIDLPLAAFIPEEYIDDLPQRLAVYQRLARTTNADELPQIHDELKDRFGELPEVVENLLYVVQLRILASAVAVEAIAKSGEHQIVLQLKADIGGARGALQQELKSVAQVGAAQIRMELRGKWRDVLVWVLESVGAFQERMMKAVGYKAQP